MGMSYTLKKYGHLLDKSKNPRENFFSIQLSLLKEGNIWLLPMEKTDVMWIGDKKPFQYTDPILVDFIQDIFPDSKFIHLVRHPFAVAESAKLFNGNGGYIWGKMTLEEVVERWTMHEKWVLELKQKYPTCVLDVRYEDLCKDIKSELINIFNFLNVSLRDGLFKEAARIVRHTPKLIPNISCTEETISIMRKYGYEALEHINPYP